MAAINSRLICLFLLTALLLSTAPAYPFKLLNLLDIHGFAEADAGIRLENDTTEKDTYNFLEQRVQFKTKYFPKNDMLADMNTEIHGKADFLLDRFADTARGEIRSFYVISSPSDWLDIKAGRQVFTWGTGDYLFINDLFPKDYRSFFIGRDDEYLKKPSDGIKLSMYNSLFNVDIVAIPFFEPNTFPQGKRLSFYDPFEGKITGTETQGSIIEPQQTINHTEQALRIYKNFRSYEAAVYLFKGFYKMPRGFADEKLKQVYFPRLNVYGASIRGPVLQGIGNIEIGFYESWDDPNGLNRKIPNSSLKAIVGYDKDLGNDYAAAGQYMIEHMLDYTDYRGSRAAGDLTFDENRSLVTLRITKLAYNQRMRLTVFNFYSPSDDDGYIRISAAYSISDTISLTCGSNIFWGKDQYTEFAQMKKNDNIYMRARYSF